MLATGQPNWSVSRTFIRWIVAWNSFFQNLDYNSVIDFSGCQYSNCRITQDRRFLSTARLVVVHCRDSFEAFPALRPKSQLWTVFCMESPPHSPDFRIFRSLNRTYTYRPDSDYYIPYFSRFPANLGPVPVKIAGATVVFLSTNCRPSNARLVLVMELMRYMPVDSYGTCLHNRDFLLVDGRAVRPPKYMGIPSQLQRFLGYYRFVLAFENSDCLYYRTEKFFNALLAGSVPIVMGKIEDEFLPERHAVISVGNFSSIRSLSQYLIWLDRNPEAYRQLLIWRMLPRHQLNPSYLDLGRKHCQTCYELNQLYWMPEFRTLDHVSAWWRVC
jgi:hypothetical protein